MIILDTNILSVLMRPAPEAVVEHWLADQAAERVFISAIIGVGVIDPWRTP